MSISSKIGCTGQTLNEWVKKAEVDAGKRAGVPTDMAAKLKAFDALNQKRSKLIHGGQGRGDLAQAATEALDLATAVLAADLNRSILDGS